MNPSPLTTLFFFIPAISGNKRGFKELLSKEPFCYKIHTLSWCHHLPFKGGTGDFGVNFQRGELKHFHDLNNFIFHYVRVFFFGVKNKFEIIEIKHPTFFLIVQLELKISKRF